MMQTLTRAATSPTLDRVSRRIHARTRKHLQRSHQLRPLLLNDQQGRTELEIRLMSRFCLNARSGNSLVGRIIHERSIYLRGINCWDGMHRVIRSTATENCSAQKIPIMHNGAPQAESIRCILLIFCTTTPVGLIQFRLPENLLLAQRPRNLQNNTNSQACLARMQSGPVDHSYHLRQRKSGIAPASRGGFAVHH